MSRFDFDVVTDPAPRPSRPPSAEPEPREAAGLDLRPADGEAGSERREEPGS
ncbi:MAG: hypothetical protein U1E53_34430 [Dongiaceae bacterium]